MFALGLHHVVQCVYCMGGCAGSGIVRRPRKKRNVKVFWKLFIGNMTFYDLLPGSHLAQAFCVLE